MGSRFEPLVQSVLLANPSSKRSNAYGYRGISNIWINAQIPCMTMSPLETYQDNVWSKFLIFGQSHGSHDVVGHLWDMLFCRLFTRSSIDGIGIRVTSQLNPIGVASPINPHDYFLGTYIGISVSKISGVRSTSYCWFHQSIPFQMFH